MIPLRLHRGLYLESAIDRAVQLYERHASISRSLDGDYVVLAIESEREGRALRVARELGNYALGLTIQGQTDKTDETSDTGASAG